MKLLEKWMEEYEASITNRLLLTKELANKWIVANKEQKTLKVNPYSGEEGANIPEMSNCCCWKISPKWRRKEIDYGNDTIILILNTIIIDGKEYEDLVYDKVPYSFRCYNADYNKAKETSYSGLYKYLSDNDCKKSDVDWVLNHTEDQIKERAHKEMLKQKEAIEAKVAKICGDTITHIEEHAADIYVKGSNGRVAHLWVITAGGYNIQCLHIRVLVKEIK